MISARQFGATNMDISSLESEIFPTVEELVNYTSQFNSAQIIIPAEVLLEALASEGNSHTTCNAQYVSIISSFGMQLHEFKRRELSLVVMLITLLIYVLANVVNSLVW